jgi:hypothetical protein
MSTASVPQLLPEVETAIKATMMRLGYTPWATGEVLEQAARVGHLEACDFLEPADVPLVEQLLDPWAAFDGARWAIGPDRRAG